MKRQEYDIQVMISNCLSDFKDLHIDELSGEGYISVMWRKLRMIKTGWQLNSQIKFLELLN